MSVSLIDLYFSIIINCITSISFILLPQKMDSRATYFNAEKNLTTLQQALLLPDTGSKLKD
jgi:hypothetical protein